MPRREPDEPDIDIEGGRAAQRLHEFEALRDGTDLEADPAANLAPPEAEARETNLDDSPEVDDCAMETNTTVDPTEPNADCTSP